jgi:hypothetical protein
MQHLCEGREMYVKILVGKSEGNRPLGTCRSKWMEILKWK